MKYTRRRGFSLLLAAAMVFSIISIGLVGLKTGALTGGSWRVYVKTRNNNTDNGLDQGSDSDVYCKFWAGDTLLFQSGDLNGTENGGNTGNTYFDFSPPVTLTRITFAKTGSDGWGVDDFNVYYTPAGGTEQTIVIRDLDHMVDHNNEFGIWEGTWFSVTHNRSITFNGNGSNAGSTPTKYLVWGTSDELPSCGFTRTGYTFAGWATSAGGSVAYSDGGNFGPMPDSNVTLYAKWTVKTYSVVFNPGYGALVSPNSKTVTYGTTYAEGAGGWPVPTKTGYTFDGWYTGFDGTGTKILGTDTVNITADLIVYAKWVPNTYTVTYNGNGSTGGSTPNSSHTYDVASYLSINGFTKLGHNFLGWSLSQSATMPTYTSGQQVTNLTATPNGIVTFYAVWRVNNYSVTFNANGGNGTMPAQTFVFGTSATLNSVTFGRTGYSFKGWATSQANANAGIIAYPNNGTYTMVTEGAVLYASWEANEYLITFNAAGGDGGWSEYLRYGQALNAPTVTKEGHMFIGWNPYVPAMVPAADTTYTAEWAVLSYTITFDANGGTGGTISTMTYGAPLTPPAVTKSGYQFAGWLPVVPATVPGFNATYVAQWAIDAYTITFDANGGTGGDVYLLQAGSAMNAPVVTREGYTFAGWSPELPATVPAQNTTYTAQWTINNYLITFDAGGGTGGTSETMNYGEALTAPDVTREGYTFAGWSPEVPATVPAQNATYTAQWTVNSYLITFDANGGAGGTSAAMDYGEPLAPPAVTKDGYTFAGWSPEVPATVPAADTVYTAQWSLNTATVQFDLNGGAGTVPESQTGEPGAAVTLPAQGDIAREYYNFLGWAQQPDATVPLVSFIIPEAGATLYAVWTRIPVELVKADGSTTVINNGEKLIFGLEEGLTKNGFAANFVRVNGDATLRYTYVSDSFGTGTVVELVDNVTGEVVETYTVIIFGDVDGDGFITVADENIIDMVSSYQLELENAAFLFAADLTQDGFVDAFDLNILSAATSYTATIDQTNPSGI